MTQLVSGCCACQAPSSMTTGLWGPIADLRLCAAQLWTHVDTELYELSVYVGYVAAGFLIAEFLFLIIFQEAVRRFDARKHPRGG